MFSRKSCYFFVRPKRQHLELCVFLGRQLRAPQVRKADRSSKSKVYHIIHVRHRDEVEAPITDWLREAYDFSEASDRQPKPSSLRKQVARRKQKRAVSKKTRRR
jgi:hypothetical protein